MTALAADGQGYAELLAALKERVATARVRAALSVNRELVLLYWSIGRDILDRQTLEGWGTKVIDRLAADLRQTFPEMKGFSARSLRYMRDFAQAWPDEAILQQAAAKLPWGHNMALLDAGKPAGEREWYARAAIEHGWSRTVLVHQIDTGLYHRQGNAATNFARTLPTHPLVVGGEDFYLDLLFCHLRLRCFVIIELKTVDFRPEFAGKMNFYLSAVDDLLRHPDDAPSIGMILCRGRNATVVEYSLRDTTKPMGVARYELRHEPPLSLAEALPTVEELTRELKELPPQDASG
ncbi:MAG: PDDEXK nuclease domain-containing protein [Janthinobacterium lividum]